MSSASLPPAPPVAAVAPAGAPAAPGSGLRLALGAASAVAVVALVSSVLLWQKISTIQEQLARQSADASTQSIEARTVARQAQEQVTEAAARLTVAETRLGDMAAQRSQIDELLHSLSRSRDENLVVDLESALRMAQQQAQLTGSMQPLIAALQSAQQRIERAAQPHLSPVQRAIAQDLLHLRQASVTDTAGLLARLDDLVRQVDDLPVLNAVAQAAEAQRMKALMRTQAASAGGASGAGSSAADAGPASGTAWWRSALQTGWEVVRDEARGLVRVGRIDQPEAVLLAPEQTFFLRENLKLKLLNARLGVLARQFEAARSDLAGATAALNKYFDPSSRRTQNAATLLQQAQANMKDAELPRLDDTLAALATAAALPR